ncbi:uncharacterized protein LOC143271614, partial [Peromyscus maniculatus bairdii]|uniref:uncharacterized protein LOC143271614 n=1 Tax=Peromyscus maniculatus bairdii TaxID=230844 RepID=UPI003FD32831
VFTFKPSFLPQNKREPHKSPRFNSNILGYREKKWSTAVQNHDNTFICVFLGVYPKSATIWEMLNLIMKRHILLSVHVARKTSPGFSDSPDLAIVKRLLDYVRLGVPSSDVTVQAKELLSVLEAHESKRGEVAWGFWALQGNNSRSPNAGCLRHGRDPASRTSFCGGATGRYEAPKGH